MTPSRPVTQGFKLLSLTLLALLIASSAAEYISRAQSGGPFDTPAMPSHSGVCCVETALHLYSRISSLVSLLALVAVLAVWLVWTVLAAIIGRN